MNNLRVSETLEYFANKIYSLENCDSKSINDKILKLGNEIKNISEKLFNVSEDVTLSELLRNENKQVEY